MPQSSLSVTPAAVRDELVRILSSRIFAGSERRRRLLEYLVERTLADGGASLKEFSIGVEVYGRDPNKYEPREDAIVRVDIARLRTRLQEYYNNEGRGDPLRLDLPRGSYAVIFAPGAAQEATKEGPHSGRRWRTRVLWGSIAALILAALWGGVRVYRARTAFHSVVVLPFLDLSPDRADEYFSDGLTDELTGQLAHIPGLRVVARTSAYAFKGKPQDVRAIGEVLHADAVVEGSIQRAGQRLRINVQLNRASDGYHLWSESYDRSAADLFRVEDDVSRSVARALRMSIAGLRPPRREPADEQAHTLYLQARYVWNQRTAAGIHQALDLLDEAIRRDPSYALAYAARADCYASMIGNEQIAPSEAAPRLIEAARKALELDDSLGEVHAALGIAELYFKHDPAGAEAEFRRAIDLSPNYPTAYQYYASALMMLRRFDEARAQLRRAHELDPLAPIIVSASALVDYLSRRPEQCRADAREVLKLEPGFWAAHYALGVCASLERRYADALNELRNAYESSGHDPTVLSDLGAVEAEAGNRAEAMRILSELQRPPAAQYTSPMELASLYSALGDRQHMFAMLDEAERQHASGLMELAVRPQYDQFRGDPQFRALLARLNLPR
ncbi:MAG TPA: tetratricopeptide repeat protein [Bryobacteraceae bacterium]|nr:tetratricopeptide repeat protein [Bryobacteraceae bacterium]